MKASLETVVKRNTVQWTATRMETVRMESVSAAKAGQASSVKYSLASRVAIIEANVSKASVFAWKAGKEKSVKNVM